MRENLSLAFILALALPACAGPIELRPDAKAIPVVHETDKPLRCKVVAEIVGSARGENAAAARESAMNDFRNAAAGHKATHAFVEKESGGPVGTTDSMQAFVGGKALQCTDGAPDEEAADAGSAEAGEAPPGL